LIPNQSNVKGWNWKKNQFKKKTHKTTQVNLPNLQSNLLDQDNHKKRKQKTNYEIKSPINQILNDKIKR